MLIVGASGGHGTAAAWACAAAGARVVLAGRRVPALERLYDELDAAGHEAALYPINLEGAQPDDFDQLGQTLQQEFGGLDGLVLAAGRLQGLAALEHLDGSEWLRTWHVHVNVAFLLWRACLPALRQAHGTLIVYLDDPERCEHALWGAYGVAQAALRAFVAIAGEESSRLGPRVLGLLAPPCRTNLNLRAFPASPPDRFCPPERIAPAVVDLLAQPGMTGSVYDARPLAAD
ncbi:MAG: SDR family NAD(P)-dependent oxidoreductase [Xanthomonadales bacterium]|nr:SDR family NAD(P)-dependent oxidoreductase [Xanthomonadales bacterium]